MRFAEIYNTLAPWAFGIAITMTALVILAVWLGWCFAFAAGREMKTNKGEDITFSDLLFATLIIAFAGFVISVFSAVLAPISIIILIAVAIAACVRIKKELF